MPKRKPDLKFYNFATRKHVFTNDYKIIKKGKRYFAYNKEENLWLIVSNDFVEKYK